MDKKRENLGIKIAIIGVIFNIILFGFKFIVGNYSNSSSIIIDGFNNLLDVISFLATFITFIIVKKPNNHYYPYRYGRVEYITGMIISFLIIMTGFEFAKTSVSRIFYPENILFSEYTLIVLIVSVLIKILIGFFSLKTSKKINSTSIKALAIDSFSDALITLLTLISFLASYIFEIKIDGYIGLISSLAIIYSGYSSIKDTARPLIGKRDDVKLNKEVENKLLSYGEIKSTHDLMIHKYGENKYYASVQVEVDGNSTVKEISNKIYKIQKEIENIFKMDINIQTISSN